MMYRVFLILFSVGFNIIWTNAAIVSSNDECVLLEDCPQLLDLIKYKRSHFGTQNLLQILHCENRGRHAYLRCISTSKIEGFMDKADLLPSEEDCGIDGLREKISGGVTADLDEYPWIALLRYKNASGDIRYGCHANLISRKYLVTAAHCVHPNSTHLKKHLLGKLHSVVLGEYDTQSKEDCIFAAYGEYCAEEIKEFMVESEKMHPDYISGFHTNDIALIRLQGETEFTDFIKPICLPPSNLILNYNDIWWTGGWGQTANWAMNNVKQKARFVYKGKDECKISINLTETQLCAGSEGEAKTCPGDLGGPLMMQKKIGDNSRTFLIGVTSLGFFCNNNASITIFTRTHMYIEWIITTLQK